MEYKWKAWSVTSVGGLMASIDSTIVTLALVPIDKELNTSYVIILWVVISYLLVNTALVLSFGRMADLLGRKNMYNLGFIIFTIGSALCGFANTGLSLVLYRVIQGIGGAFLIANSMAIITEVFPPQERGKAFGFNAIIWAVGSITGVALGGIIITFTSSWRWIFFINVPIGIFGTIWAYATLHQDKVSGNKESFDLPAAIAFTLMLVFLLVGITLGLLNGWNDLGAIVLMCISPLFLIVFLVWEVKFSQNPIIPLTMFRNRVFTLSIVTVLFQSLALFSVNFLLVFYFEGIAGLTPLTASFLIIPMSVVNAIVGPFAGKWSDKVGARVVATLGLLIQFGMLVILSTMSTTIPLWEALWEVGIVEALFGLGGGLFYPANTSTVMSASPPGRYGVTSGVLTTFRNTGMILSFVVSMIAVTSAINPTYVYQLFLGTLAGSLPPDVGASYMIGQSAAFILSAFLILVAAFFSLVRGKLPPRSESSATTSITSRGTEDSVRIERLKKLVQVSRNLKVSQVAKILEMSEDDLYSRLVDWAADYGFFLDEDNIEFGTSNKDEFITKLDEEFANWSKQGKNGKV